MTRTVQLLGKTRVIEKNTTLVGDESLVIASADSADTDIKIDFNHEFDGNRIRIIRSGSSAYDVNVTGKGLDESLVLDNETLIVQYNKTANSWINIPVDGKSAGLGWGQTWQSVSGSRAAGVAYTNNTGRPIVVCVGWTVTYSNAGIVLSVDTTVVSSNGYYAGTGSNQARQVMAIVPNGSIYQFSGGISFWVELR